MIKLPQYVSQKHCGLTIGLFLMTFDHFKIKFFFTESLRLSVTRITI